MQSEEMNKKCQRRFYLLKLCMRILWGLVIISHLDVILRAEEISPETPNSSDFSICWVESCEIFYANIHTCINEEVSHNNILCDIH